MALMQTKRESRLSLLLLLLSSNGCGRFCRSSWQVFQLVKAAHRIFFYFFHSRLSVWSFETCTLGEKFLSYQCHPLWVGSWSLANGPSTYPTEAPLPSLSKQFSNTDTWRTDVLLFLWAHHRIRSSGLRFAFMSTFFPLLLLCFLLLAKW